MNRTISLASVLFVLIMMCGMSTAYAQKPSLYTLTLSASPISPIFDCTVTASPVGPYKAGTKVTITAAANKLFVFKNWSGDISTISDASAASTTIIMNGNYVVTGNFINRVSTYTITATTGANGSISPSGEISVKTGSNKTFTITPDAGYEVEDIIVDGVSVGVFYSYTFSNVTADHTIHVTFQSVGIEEGYISGMVTPNIPTTITTTGGGYAETLSDGSYFMTHEAGTFTLTAEADGYETFTTTVTVDPMETTIVDIMLTSGCDAVAMLSCPSSVMVGEAISFDISGSIGNLLILDYGDGITETVMPDSIVMHTYSNMGTYTVTLTATGTNECEDTMTATISVVIVISFGYIKGMVMPNVPTTITTTGGGYAETISDGSYFLSHSPGTFTLKAHAEGYEAFTATVLIEPMKTTVLDIAFNIKGDIDGNGKTDLADAIAVLNILTGFSLQPAYPASVADVNGDDRIGLEDAVYILQRIAKLR